MTATVDKLESLARRCEEATGPDRELDARIAHALADYPDSFEKMREDGYAVRDFEAQPFTGSLDAAMSLVPEGHEWVMPFPNECRISCNGRILLPLAQTCATPALALCAAALRSRSQEALG